MPLARSGGSLHRIRYLSDGIYEISWRYEMKYAGSRQLWHRSITRETDEAGAKRFSRKWNTPMPEISK